MIDLLVALYVLGYVFFAGGFIFDELSFRNPDYTGALLWALIWPLLIISGVMLQVWGFGIGDVYEDVKTSVTGDSDAR